MGYVRPERAKRPANRPKWPLQSLRRPVWAIRFFEIHDPGAFDEHFFNGLLGLKMDEYIDAQREATGFDLRYTATMAPPDKDWRDCTAVLSRRDFAVLMTTAWSG